MNSVKQFGNSVIFLMSAIIVLLSTGCATTPKVDWTSRIGNYTYDQTVRELGPPDRSAKLSDGSLVAEWLVQRGRNHVYASGFSYYDYYPGYPYFVPAPGPLYYSESATPDYFVRLTFDPQGVLTAAQRVRR